MSSKTDPVSPELRQIESQLDNVYQTNYLASLKFAQGAWYLLATAEDTVLAPIIRQDSMSPHDIAVDADRFLTHIQYPLAWLYKTCPAGGAIPFDTREVAYKAALELLEMAASYKSVVAAYTYATKGMIDLELDGTEIIAKHNFRSDSRYEAYSRLLKPTDTNEPFQFAPIFDIARNGLRVEHDRFTYKVSPKIVEDVKAVVRPVYEHGFTLPLAWRFARYSMQDYLEFAISLGAISSLHWSARYLAAANGCVGLGYRDSVMVFDDSELVSRITRYSQLPYDTVVEIIGDLTYGNRGIRQPDPALQPLIPLTKDKLALAPWIWLSSAVERNLSVLVNRLPAEQKIYARLVDEKENAMRAQIMADLAEKQYRFVYGDLPYSTLLPDIDLALISGIEHVCLLLELKWFIDPAEIGEVITRAEDLKKGVAQIHRFQDGFRAGTQSLFEKLGIDLSYTLGFAVVSANWIGFEDVQDPEVPIINQRHFTAKVLADQGLLSVLEWLNKRSYLPSEGVEYDIVDEIAQLGEWKLKWYAIKPLLKKEFLPL